MSVCKEGNAGDDFSRESAPAVNELRPLAKSVRDRVMVKMVKSGTSSRSTPQLKQKAAMEPRGFNSKLEHLIRNRAHREKTDKKDIRKNAKKMLEIPRHVLLR